MGHKQKTETQNYPVVPDLKELQTLWGAKEAKC